MTKTQPVDYIRHFTSSLDLRKHPMKYSKPKIKAFYLVALEYFVKTNSENSDYIDARLRRYRELLTSSSNFAQTPESSIKSLINNRLMPWRSKYRYWLLCDLALLLLEKPMIERAFARLCEFLNRRQISKLDVLFAALWNDDAIPKKLLFAANLVDQFRVNRRFLDKPLTQILITATVSAGKSTLINAITGKPLTRMAQEICTEDLEYVYNKPFEDEVIRRFASRLNHNAAAVDLEKGDDSVAKSISAYFRSIISETRFCIIDTPGVNSTISRHHGAITRNALQEKKYDTVVYIINANRLGSNDEMRYLKWVSENVPKEKVVFVLNKLDDFKEADDSISASIDGVKNDLIALGYEKPLIFPLSAYCAYLVKRKWHGGDMTKCELNAYALYAEKFTNPKYDLSKYDDGVYTDASDSEEMAMLKRCGIYGLEKLLCEADENYEKGFY